MSRRIVLGNRTSQVRTSEESRGRLKETDFKYEYPDKLDLKPGSELHEKLIEFILLRAQESRDAISARYETWAKVDETLTAYIRLDDKEKKVQAQDDRRPVSIVVPVTFATMETLLTYRTAAFLRDVIFKYDGFDPRDVAGAYLLERVIQHQSMVGTFGLNLHTQWRDDMAYGIGITSTVWNRETMPAKRKVEKEQNIVSRVFGSLFNMEPEYTEEAYEKVIYEGNEIVNIDPYQYFPDPSLPIDKVQKGESVGWINRSNKASILEEEQLSKGSIFNAKYLAYIDGQSVLYDDSESGRESKTGIDVTNIRYSEHFKPCDKLYMYVYLIPKDWGIGESEYPETWLFCVVGDEVIIQANKYESTFKRFPVSVSAPDFDGHAICPIGRLEVTYGMQQAIDFLFNTHMTNVRKAINDMIVVDPSVINMNDLMNPGPGKLIRLRRKSWGKNIKDSIQQLQVNDITRQHMQDATFLMDVINRTSSASDALQGVVRKGSERRSATEFRETVSGSMSRLERVAKICWMQSLYPTSQMLAHNTQKYMSEEQYVKIAGEWINTINNLYGGKAGPTGAVKVSREMLDCNFDIVPHDGSVPNSGDPNTWLEILRLASTSPVIAQSVDVVKIFKHLAIISGAKNIEDFMSAGADFQVQNQQQIQQGVQAGNLVPMNQMAGG